MRFTPLLIFIIVPALVFSQSRKERKEQERINKELLINLNNHLLYFTGDTLQNRTPGSVSELKTSKYISSYFEQAGLEPKGTKNFFQDFPIYLGKQISDAENTLQVNDSSLKLGKDFFPMIYSPKTQVQGLVSPGLHEKGEPWFFDIKDVLEDNEDNASFDIHKTIRKEAATAAAKGAKALLIYNTGSIDDKIIFTAELKPDVEIPEVTTIPVLYITKTGMETYIPDEIDIYNINFSVNIQNKFSSGRNVIGYINNNASRTVLIGAHYDDIISHDNQPRNNSLGMSVMLELARLLKTGTATTNNYLFIAFSGEVGLFGSKYWISQTDSHLPLNYMLNIELNNNIQNSIKISGFNTSGNWKEILPSVQQHNLEIVPTDLNEIRRSDFVNFYKNNIPVFCIAGKSSDETVIQSSQILLNVLKYIQEVINTADVKGKIQFSQDVTIQ